MSCGQNRIAGTQALMETLHPLPPVDGVNINIYTVRERLMMQVFCGGWVTTGVPLHVQQNSCNPMRDNSEILLVQPLRVIPRPEVLLHCWNRQIDLKDIQNDIRQCLYINHFGISWPTVSFLLHQVLQVWILRKTLKEHPEDPDPADERNIQMEYCFD